MANSKDTAQFEATSPAKHRPPKRTIAEMEDRVRHLQEFIRTLAPGQRVTFLEFEQATGIRMTAKAKDAMRVAMEREERTFLSIHGYGIQMTCPKTAVQAMTGKIGRVLSAGANARKANRRLKNEHLEKMDEPSKRKLIAAGAFLGALETIAGEYRPKILERPSSDSSGH